MQRVSLIHNIHIWHIYDWTDVYHSCYSVYVQTTLCVYDINLFKRMVHIAVNGKCYNVTTPQQPSLLNNMNVSYLTT